MEDLPEPPPDRVARHRVSYPPGDGETQARRPELVGESMHREQPAPVSGALPVNPLELRGVGQASALTPWQRSDSEPTPTAPAARGDDPAPANRAHALAKTVRLGPLSAVWLVRTLHKTPLWAYGCFEQPREYIRSHGTHPANAPTLKSAQQGTASRSIIRKVLQKRR